MTNSIDRILGMLDNGLQRAGDAAYPTERGAAMVALCWRCQARPHTDPALELCTQCATDLRNPDAIPAPSPAAVETMIDRLGSMDLPPQAVEALATLARAVVECMRRIDAQLSAFARRAAPSLAARLDAIDYARAHDADACIEGCPFCRAGLFEATGLGTGDPPSLLVLLNCCECPACRTYRIVRRRFIEDDATREHSGECQCNACEELARLRGVVLELHYPGEIYAGNAEWPTGPAEPLAVPASPFEVIGELMADLSGQGLSLELNIEPMPGAVATRPVRPLGEILERAGSPLEVLIATARPIGDPSCFCPECRAVRAGNERAQALRVVNAHRHDGCPGCDVCTAAHAVLAVVPAPAPPRSR